MRRIIVIALIAIAAAAFATGQMKNKKGAGGNNIEQAIKQLETERNQALVRSDTAFIDRLYSDDYTSMVGSTSRTKAQVIADLKSGDLKIEATSNDKANVRVYGNTAVVTGRSTGKILDKGQENSGQSYFTRVYVKQSGQWRLVANHSSRITQQ